MVRGSQLVIFATFLGAVLAHGCSYDFTLGSPEQGSSGSSGSSGDSGVPSSGSCNASAVCTCDTGSCKLDCPVTGAPCAASCAANTSCELNCIAGRCSTACAAGAACTMNCIGGGCAMTCVAGSSCTLNCLGGDCTCTGAGCP